MTPAEERRLRARAAAKAMHAKHGRSGTAGLRRGFMRKFESQVDPDEVLPVAERQRRAQLALESHMIGLSVKAARARAERARERSA